MANRRQRSLEQSCSLLVLQILFLLLCRESVECLTMTEIKIPKHIMRHEDATLGCKFDLDGESLYSVKWYKDGFEFYRYVPRDLPPGQVFPLPGVDVECLVEIIHPRTYEEAIEDIAEDIRKPIVHDPIASGLRLIKGNREFSVLHMDNCEKLYQSLAQFNVRPTAETLDKVVPVNDEQLGNIAEALSQLNADLEDDYEDEEDENDDGDEYEDDDEDDEDENDKDDEETQTAENIREFNIMNMAM